MRVSKEKNSEYFRKWYAANRQTQLDRVRQSKTLKQQYIREAKSRPCKDCGVQYPFYVMQFDHVESKNFGLSTAHDRKGWASIKAEIDLCEVVCANCHAERTYQRAH